jgi:hypothetical protein
MVEQSAEQTSANGIGIERLKWQFLGESGMAKRQLWTLTA